MCPEGEPGAASAVFRADAASGCTTCRSSRHVRETNPRSRAERGVRDHALGIDLDADANARRGPCISRPGSRVSAWVIPTNEELMIARHTGIVLGLIEARA